MGSDAHDQLPGAGAGDSSSPLRPPPPRLPSYHSFPLSVGPLLMSRMDMNKTLIIKLISHLNDLAHMWIFKVNT